MQPAEILCYTFLTITLTSVCVNGEHQKQELAEKRISKRDASIFIDSYPAESSYRQKPKIIYRRISRQRYRKPIPKYGPPRAKYGPPRSSWKAVKKYRGKQVQKYGPPSPIKTKYGPPKSTARPVYGPPKSTARPVYGPPKKTPHYTYFAPDPAGFGEPPINYANAYVPPNSNYAEPPVDSYGTPLKTSVIDSYPTSETFAETPSNTENHNFGQEYQSYLSFQRDQNIDTNYAYSKKHPTFVKPEPEHNEDYNLDSYSDVFKHGEHFNEQNVHEIKKKPQYFLENVKVSNKPWIASNVRTESNKMLVGGQYAEPPARYVPFQPSAPMYSDDKEFSPPRSYDSEVASSNISPYINYKNSNMAFSPQNLNDAFSIVDI